MQVVQLLTSELVSNAIRHASGTDIKLELVVEFGDFTVAVCDGSDDLPIIRTTGPEVPGGHGMRMIEVLATAWGTQTYPSGGKAVWFTVTHDQPPHRHW